MPSAKELNNEQVKIDSDIEIFEAESSQYSGRVIKAKADIENLDHAIYVAAVNHDIRAMRQLILKREEIIESCVLYLKSFIVAMAHFYNSLASPEQAPADADVQKKRNALMIFIVKVMGSVHALVRALEPEIEYFKEVIKKNMHIDDTIAMFYKLHERPNKELKKVIDNMLTSDTAIPVNDPRYDKAMHIITSASYLEIKNWIIILDHELRMEDYWFTQFAANKDKRAA